MDEEEALTVLITHAVASPEGRLRLATAEEFIIGELERNRFNTERAVEVYRFAISDSVWAWVKDTPFKFMYREFLRSGLGKKLATELTEKFKKGSPGGLRSGLRPVEDPTSAISALLARCVRTPPEMILPEQRPAPVEPSHSAASHNAATNKYLAQSNKCRTGAEATKKRRLRRGAICCAGQVSQRQDPVIGSALPCSRPVATEISLRSRTRGINKPSELEIMMIKRTSAKRPGGTCPISGRPGRLRDTGVIHRPITAAVRQYWLGQRYKHFGAANVI
jgi:hypothetical protein